MKRLYAFLIAAALCFPSIGALAWWQSIQQVGVSSGGVGAADLNFATAAYTGCTQTSCLTDTNSTGGYCTDSTGAIHSIAANTLRICSGTGLLVEEGRTNSLFYSNLYTGISWSRSAASVSQNLTGPDSVANSGWTITFTASSASNQSQPIVIAAGSSVSCYIQHLSAQWVYFQINDHTNAAARGTWFDVLNGVLGTNNVAIGSPATLVLSNPSITVGSNGWDRISVENTGDAVAQFNIGVSTADASRTLSSTLTLGMYGCQYEAGAFPTSYIITPSNATVARSADNIAVSGVLATTLAASTGTIVANTNNSQQSVAGTLVDANGTVLLGKTSGNVGTTAVGATLSTGNTATWTGANDLGLAWDASGGALQLNAGTIATDATARTPAATFHIGSTSGSSAFLDGYVARLTAYTTKQVSPQ